MKRIPIEIRRCVYCDLEFKTNIPSKIYCSNRCRSDDYSGKRTLPNFKTKISPGSMGALSELVVCSDLLRMGYSVFRSVSQCAPFDVIAYKNDIMKRIEIRTGYKLKNGKLMFSGHNGIPYNKFDLYAVYDKADNSIAYIPELEDKNESDI
jgi:hypothetical protein